MIVFSGVALHYYDTTHICTKYSTRKENLKGAWGLLVNDCTQREIPIPNSKQEFLANGGGLSYIPMIEPL